MVEFAGEVWSFVRIWGSALGPTLDVIGAVLVFVGVYISPPRALSVERNVIEETIDDIGAPELIAKNEGFNRARAFERLRASRWAAIGLGFVIAGFICQAIGGLPKSI